ncbi:hypothetical protein D3C78_1148510 [compost metagenome]
MTRVRPRASSSVRMRRLKAGWVTKRFCAAWEKLRVAARATKSSSHLLSRFIAPPPAAAGHPGVTPPIPSHYADPA